MKNESVQPVAPPTAGSPNPDPWEDAYLRFETPEQEIRKFGPAGVCERAPPTGHARRIYWICFPGGAMGFGLLEQIGFTRLQGIDLSPRLAGQYRAMRGDACG